MSTKTNLPIYKTVYDLLTEVAKLTADFSRQWKFTLGDRIFTQVEELSVDILEMKESTDTNFDDLLKRLKRVKLLLRLSKDLHLISIKQFSGTVVLTESIITYVQGKKSTKPLLAESY
jgi:hypothetical protein